jgi:hypothetical protein
MLSEVTREHVAGTSANWSQIECKHLMILLSPFFLFHCTYDRTSEAFFSWDCKMIWGKKKKDKLVYHINIYFFGFVNFFFFGVA